MPRGVRKTKKQAVSNQLSEHIAEYADVGFADSCDDSGDFNLDTNNEMDDIYSTFDDSDRSWMYDEENLYTQEFTEDMDDEEYLYEETGMDITDETTGKTEVKPEEKKKRGRKKGSKNIKKEKTDKEENPIPLEKNKSEHGLDSYMTAAAWFREMKKRKKISSDEKRYLDLMLIEMSDFYFKNMDKNKYSKKCKEALKSIHDEIEGAGLC